MLKNASSLAIVGLDTAENGPSKVRQVTNKIEAIIGPARCRGPGPRRQPPPSSDFRHPRTDPTSFLHRSLQRRIPFASFCEFLLGTQKKTTVGAEVRARADRRGRRGALVALGCGGSGRLRGPALEPSSAWDPEPGRAVAPPTLLLSERGWDILWDFLSEICTFIF